MTQCHLNPSLIQAQHLTSDLPSKLQSCEFSPKKTKKKKKKKKKKKPCREHHRDATIWEGENQSIFDLKLKDSEKLVYQ